MKKLKFTKVLPIALMTPLASLTSLTSCGIFSRSVWSWKESTKDSTEINYCLLIGQNDHSDSIERTRYTRKALGTLDESEATKTRTKNNPNVADPIEGKLTVNKTKSNEHTFKVKEIEHMEQKSMAGATWDPITANNSATTWIAKHDKKITFFVSNNDSMAEGAYWASNWVKNMPIFGYDANPSTIKMIDAGYITGTVDQNASTQCGAAMMMLRNMIDDNGDDTSRTASKYGTVDYNPLAKGFESGKEGTTHSYKYGWVDTRLMTLFKEDGWFNKHIKPDSDAKTDRAIKSASTGIDKDNVKSYLKGDGEAKKPADMFDLFTTIKKPDVAPKQGKILMTYNNKAEVYLVSTLKPYFNEYASRLNLDLDVLEGDGTGEGVVINQIKTKEGQDFDGFLINMTYTTSADSYIEELAKIAAKGKDIPEGGWPEFKDRLDTPVIFWNRQPQKDGECDNALMNNKFFKYCYFIGVDAAAGGQVQGDLIVKNITNWYNNQPK